MRALSLFCFALLALVASAFAFNVNAPKATAPTKPATLTSSLQMNLDFEDSALENMMVKDDPDAQPARKCASCFG